MSATNTISELKAKIEAATKMSTKKQIILCRGEEAGDDFKSLETCGIADGAVLCVIPRKISNDKNIILQMENGKTYTINLEENEDVPELKQKIFEKFKIEKQDQTLIYKSRTIIDGDKFSDLGIRDAFTELTLKRIIRNAINIFAQTMDGKTVSFSVRKNDNISDMKIKVQDRLGLYPDEQKLVFQGGSLDDDQTVGYYGISDKSCINVIVRLRNGIQIFAQTIDGKTVSIEMNKNDKISDVKIKIQGRLGLNPDEQKLIFQGKALDDHNTFEYYGISDKSCIYVIVRRRNEIQIFARTMDGQTVAFEVDKTDKISDVKIKIQSRLELYPNEQKLVFQRGILEDDKTVEYYGMVDKSVINVVARLRDGIVIYLKTLEGKIVTFEVTKNHKIREIKDKLKNKIELHPDEQSFFFQSQLLDDHKTIGFYEIGEKSVINVVAITRNEIQIFAKTMDGRTLAFEVNKNDKISDVKIKIQHKLGRNTVELKLIFQCEILRDDKTIDECEIIDRSMINLFCLDN